MSSDLMDLSEWLFYDPPEPEPVSVAKLPAWRWHGGEDGYVRAASRRTFVTPATVTCSFAWEADNDPDGPEWLGLHWTFMQDEDHVYDFGLRHDGRMVWLQQYRGEYTQLCEFQDHGARPDGRRHQIRFKFTPEWLSANINGHRGGVLNASLGGSRFPPLLGGRVGMRVDRQVLSVYHLAASS